MESRGPFVRLPRAKGVPAPDAESPEATPSGADGLFPATSWTQILNSQNEDPTRAMAALDHLARAYWRPLYVFLRQRGYHHDAAAESVQGFFVHLLSRGFLRNVRPEAGRFRTFLLVCFTRWLHDERARALAERRGGGQKVLSLDEFDSVRDMLAVEGQSPEDAFDRRWAVDLLAAAERHLRAQWAGRPQLFEALRGSLFGSAPPESYAEIGHRLGLTEGAVKKAAFDLRQGIARLVRQEVLRTLSDEKDLADELRHLVRLLRQ